MPLEILHRTAPCRNVPVTFTLDLMTRRRDRQVDRRPLDVRLISEISVIADRPFVARVDDHFAGYFNELGLTVVLNPDAGDEDLLVLENDLLMHLDHFWAEHRPDFKWMVMFSRGVEKNLRTMFPGDKPRRTSEDLYWCV